MLPIIAIVSALIFQLILKSVSTEWCSSQFINETESKIDKKINAVEMDFFKIVLIVGVVLGIVLDIILFATGIYKFRLFSRMAWDITSQSFVACCHYDCGLLVWRGIFF